jgi:uncharacterized protein (TIGR02118 family)
VDEHREPVGEDAGGDPLLAVEELAEGVFAVEDDVAHHEHRPRIAEDLYRDVDRTARISPDAPHETTISEITCVSQVISDMVSRMIRFLVLYPQPTDAPAFDRHYHQTHLPLAKQLPGLRSYKTSRNPATVRGEERYYLVAELEWDDMTALQADFRSPLGEELSRDVDQLAELCPGIQSMVYELEAR